MNNFFNTKTICLITLIISIISLLSAIYIEHSIGIKPCKLCIYQRVPYLLAIFVSFLGYYYSNNKLFINLLILIFVTSFVISGYHVGIENEIFNEFPGCTSQNIKLLDKSEILDSLKNSALSCKNVDFKILGISLATINFIISSILVVLYLKVLLWKKQIKKN
tara:strand:+ start:322 stop:810 length:489 start_codon:yes stop_codon:yes gene_type:complete